ncbi:MAG TPA: hypothetical protein EYP59_04975 [Thiotrichaceae bacterium]|nr:hypothetical protein [Thiotrichaceae bacterium]
MSNIYFHSALAKKTCLSVTMAAVMAGSAFAGNEPYLTHFQQLTNDGNSIAPQFSPMSSNAVGFTHSKYQGIYLLNDVKKAIKALRARKAELAMPEELTSNLGSGFKFAWGPKGKRILYRIAKKVKSGKAKFGGKYLKHALTMIDLQTKQHTDLSGEAEVISVPRVRDGKVFFEKDGEQKWVNLSEIEMSKMNLNTVTTETLSIVEKDGRIMMGEKTLSDPDTQCWLPALSPNGKNAHFECANGLYIYNGIKDKVIFLGTGTNARWARNSGQLVYEKTTDNGHDITGSDIYLVNYDGTNQVNLTSRFGGIARRPTLSADGKTVAMDIDGNIYTAQLKGGK